MNKVLLLCFLVLVNLPGNLAGQKFSFDFQGGTEGWTGDFADYPAGDSLFYQLKFAWQPLPHPLDSASHALMLTGNNHSDDLFMFIKKKITGLTPNKLYSITISMEIASEAPTHAIGIGGAPGESVFLKAGATLIEPRKVLNEGFFLMNIDKANQAGRGTDMDTLGHIGVTDTTTVFTIIERSNKDHPFRILTDDSGEVWICIGTDSGFEGTTTVYYSRIEVSFDNATSISEEPVMPEISLYPNPARGTVTIVPEGSGLLQTEIIGMDGSIKLKYQHQNILHLGNLKPGIYMVRITTTQGTVIKKLVKRE
jgi:hypothetical protein